MSAAWAPRLLIWDCQRQSDFPVGGKLLITVVILVQANMSEVKMNMILQEALLPWWPNIDESAPWPNADDSRYGTTETLSSADASPTCSLLVSFQLIASHQSSFATHLPQLPSPSEPTLQPHPILYCVLLHDYEI